MAFDVEGLHVNLECQFGFDLYLSNANSILLKALINLIAYEFLQKRN
jgi:hypothetical protein